MRASARILVCSIVFLVYATQVHVLALALVSQPQTAQPETGAKGKAVAAKPKRKPHATRHKDSRNVSTRHRELHAAQHAQNETTSAAELSKLTPSAKSSTGGAEMGMVFGVGCVVICLICIVVAAEAGADGTLGNVGGSYRQPYASTGSSTAAKGKRSQGIAARGSPLSMAGIQVSSAEQLGASQTGYAAAPTGYSSAPSAQQVLQRAATSSTVAQNPPNSMQPRFRTSAPPLSDSFNLGSAGQPATGQPSLLPTMMQPEQQPQQQPPQRVNMPPPLCKDLILPSSEAWFAIQFKDLELQGSGNFDIFGLSGKPLLKAAADVGPNNGSVMLSMKPGKSPMLGQIIQTAVPRPGVPPAPLMLKTKNNGHYGELQASGHLQFTLICSGAPVLKVIFQQNSGQLFVVTADAQATPMASASRCTESDFFQGVEHLEIRVSAGVDAVLALLCLIGVILFDLPHGAGDIPVSAAQQH